MQDKLLVISLNTAITLGLGTSRENIKVTGDIL
jgi:hypothetical protein